MTLWRVNGVKDDLHREDFDPIAQMRQYEEARESMRSVVAKTFLGLLKEGKIPPWVVRSVDLKMIRLAGIG